MIAAVLFDEGALSGKRSFGGQSESWPDRGPPERPTRLLADGGAPGGAAPSVNGRARSHCAARGGSVNPASKGASQALWRLPPLHRPRALARDLGNLGRNRAARMRKRGCLKIVDRI